MKTQNERGRGKRKRAQIGLAILMVLALSACTMGLPNWDITEDTEISGGEYNVINIYDTPPDHTTVNMTGGLADWMGTHDESTLNVSGGESDFGAYDYSVINISGGAHSGADAYGHGTVNCYSNSVLTSIGAVDDGIVNIYGGMIDHVGAHNSGIVNVWGGLISERLGAWESSMINIYGFDIVKNDTGGAYGYGEVYGHLSDGTYISVDLCNEGAYSRVSMIPEPSCLILLLLGAMFIQLKKRS